MVFKFIEKNQSLEIEKGKKQWKKVLGLKCRECGEQYPKEPLHVLRVSVFGPLEVDYDYEVIRKNYLKAFNRERSQKVCGRYADLLPIDGEPTDGENTGFTPLVRAKNLAGRARGQGDLYKRRHRLPSDVLL